MSAETAAAPTRLLPLHHEHLRARAQMVERDGWLQPWAYADPEREARVARATAGLLDASATTRVAVKGAQVEAALEAAWPGAATAPLQVAAPEPGLLVCRLAPDEALVLAPIAERAAVLARLEERMATVAGCAHVLDVTSGHAGMQVVGPRARDLLSRCTALDLRPPELPNRRCAQAALARVHALVVRDDLGDLPAFQVHVARDYAAFVWEWLLEVGHAFGAVPCGLGALERLRATAAEGAPA